MMRIHKKDLDFSVEDATLFVQVATHGSFIRASETLYTRQAKVTQRIAHLEEVFGATLFYRDMRTVRLTATGKIVFDMAKEIVERTNATYRAVQNEHKEMVGPINLTVATSFANFWLAKHLPEFIQKYPEIQLTIKTNELGSGHLMLGETDIAIASSRPTQRERLVCDLLCEYPFHIYASKDYLHRKGTPLSVKDLDRHDVIAMSEVLRLGLNSQLFNALLYLGRHEDNPRHPILTVERDLMVLTMTLSGLGLGCIPTFFAEKFPNLQRLDIEGAEVILDQQKNQKFMVYPKILEKSSRHQALILFIREKVQSFLS